MALQLSGLRKGLLSSSSLLRTTNRLNNQNHHLPITINTNHALRFQSSKDVGDVIGIDLGTTNSCVAIMVSSFLDHSLAIVVLSMSVEFVAFGCECFVSLLKSLINLSFSLISLLVLSEKLNLFSMNLPQKICASWKKIVSLLDS